MRAFKMKLYDEGDIRTFDELRAGDVFTPLVDDDRSDYTYIYMQWEVTMPNGDKYRALNLEYGDPVDFDPDDKVEVHRKEWDRDDDDEDDEDDTEGGCDFRGCLGCPHYEDTDEPCTADECPLEKDGDAE